MMSFDSITSFHLDILKEIGNIGAGHAATALSDLLNKPIDMKVPSVKVIGLNDISDMVGGAETIVASVFLRIMGEAPGGIFFMLPLQLAEQFVQYLTGETSVNSSGFSEISISALQEVGNILAGSYLSSLSDFTGLNLQPSVPATAIDMAGAILSFGLMEISIASDHAIVIDTSFTDMADQNSKEVQGQFFLLPDPDSFQKIFTALGVPLNG